MEDLFESYDGQSIDFGQLKKDTRNHPRTSTASLRQYARYMAATPEDKRIKSEVKSWLKDPHKRAPNKAQYWPESSAWAHEQLMDALLWMSTHRSELPREIENEDGTINGSVTFHETTMEYYDDLIDDNSEDFDGSGDWSKYEEHGMYHMERSGAYATLTTVTNELIASTKDLKLREWRRANPTSRHTREAALELRGKRYQSHAERQAKRLQWRGMEEYDAVAKADEKLREGLKRKPTTSGAKPLPNIDNLRVTFGVCDGVLVRRSLGRPVVGKKVKVLGQVYATDRIAYAVEHGSDPADKIVRNGVATNYRKAEGHVRQNDSLRWESLVYIDREAITVGTYRSERQAKEACRLYLASLDMGIL